MEHIKNLILLCALLLGILTTFNHQPINARYNSENSTRHTCQVRATNAKQKCSNPHRFRFSSMIGTPQQCRNPQDKLSKLYKKRDNLQSKIREIKSEKRRTRMQRSIDKVQDEIRKYERPHNMKRV